RPRSGVSASIWPIGRWCRSTRLSPNRTCACTTSWSTTSGIASLGRIVTRVTQHSSCAEQPRTGTHLAAREGAEDVTLPELHRQLLEAYRTPLPFAEDTRRTAWWTMDGDEPYLWTQLAHHLRESGGTGCDELERLVIDLRWVVAKLELLGLPAVDAD